MALRDSRLVTENIRLGIWHINEQLDELLMLAESLNVDTSGCENFNSEIRKCQWISSRVLLKKMIPEEHVSLYYDDRGKPHLKNYDAYVSISHSDNYATLILDKSQPTGIDVERFSPKIYNVRNRFLSERENNEIDKKYELESLITAWAVKEAMYKTHGRKKVIFKRDMSLEPFQYNGEGEITGHFYDGMMHHTHQLKYENLDDHIMVYLLNR